SLELKQLFERYLPRQPREIYHQLQAALQNAQEQLQKIQLAKHQSDIDVKLLKNKKDNLLEQQKDIQLSFNLTISKLAEELEKIDAYKFDDLASHEQQSWRHFLDACSKIHHPPFILAA